MKANIAIVLSCLAISLWLGEYTNLQLQKRRIAQREQARKDSLVQTIVDNNLLAGKFAILASESLFADNQEDYKYYSRRLKEHNLVIQQCRKLLYPQERPKASR